MLVIDKIEMSGELEKKIRKLAAIQAGAKVGILSGATYDDGQSVAYVAYINEVGDGMNPKRPFIKKTRVTHQEKYIKGIAANLKGGKAFSRASVVNAYKMAAMTARGDMQRIVMDWPDADPRLNSPDTIKRKAKRGRSSKNTVPISPTKALVDTGTMVKAINFEVIE